MIWEGARDHDGGDEPSVLSDTLCLLLALFNAVAWPVLVWLIFGP